MPRPHRHPLLDQVADASPKLDEGLARAVPMRRIAQPVDIAPAVAFLLSAGAGYITGQTLSVSGGLTMAVSVSMALDIEPDSVSTQRDMNTKRTYDMRSRAEAAAGTRRRILQATLDLCMEAVIVEITLEDVAGRAGVSVKTVLRHFGSRDGLFDALEGFGREQIAQERYAPPGDVGAAVRAVFDHYELRGDAVLRMLAQELWDARMRAAMDEGRRMHREWVETVFAPLLKPRSAAGRAALVDLLVVAADLYTWKLLRRDRGLPRDTAEARVRRMIDALLACSGEET